TLAALLPYTGLAIGTLPAFLPKRPPILSTNLTCWKARTGARKCVGPRCSAKPVSWHVAAYHRLSCEITQPTKVADVLGPDHHGSRPSSRPCNDGGMNLVLRNGATIHSGHRLRRDAPVYGIPAIEKFSAADEDRVLEVNLVRRKDDLRDVRRDEI